MSFNNPLISAAVGNNLDNNPDDVLAVKKSLADEGYYDTPIENGYIDRPLDTAIKDFQKDNDLKVDGLLTPGGETEEALKEKRTSFVTKEESTDTPYPNIINIEGRKINRRGIYDAFERIKRTPVMSLSAEKETDTIKPPVPKKKPEPQELEIPKEYVDKIEKTYRKYVETGKKMGMTDAASNLEHFLDNSGTDKIFTREEAREFKFIKKGEKTNEKRFENSFLDKDSKIGQKLSSLKDGEEVALDDFWDHQTSWKNPNPTKNSIVLDGFNSALAFGTTNLKSTGNFKAKRTGNTITINGKVNHNWNDTYDFKPHGSGGGTATTLKKSGQAKDFKFSSQWEKQVKGAIDIKDGKPGKTKLEWKDINN